MSTAIDDFWARCRETLPHLPEATPLAWPFGATREHADELLGLVLAETKTATASSLWDYEATGDPLPVEGELSIILDGDGQPKALIETTQVRTAPFDQVDAGHAYEEGEGDRSLDYWRASHERFWRTHSENDRGFASDMPVICERFRLLIPRR